MINGGEGEVEDEEEEEEEREYYENENIKVKEEIKKLEQKFKKHYQIFMCGVC